MLNEITGFDNSGSIDDLLYELYVNGDARLNMRSINALVRCAFASWDGSFCTISKRGIDTLDELTRP